MSQQQSKQEQVASAFDRTLDPLAEYDATFKQLNVDPHEMWLRDCVYNQEYAEGTVSAKKRHLKQWREFIISEHNRHPAVPTTQHVVDFAHHCVNKQDNQGSTVAAKIQTLNLAFEYFQNQSEYPQDEDFNPFDAPKQKLNLSDDDPDPPHQISVDELRRKIHEDIKHIRDRALIVTQLKLGIRASETANIKLCEIHIDNAELQDHYEELGTHPVLESRSNAVYIPPDRALNKSDNPRVLPLDDELRRLLLQYLLCRPDNGKPWVFLSKSGGKQLDQDNINHIWKNYFRPTYGPTDRFRGVSSHFGRHFFTTWFTVKQEWSRDDVSHMRGDKSGDGEVKSSQEAIDAYIHRWFEDIEDPYRQDIFKLRV